jgi:hypothetical protein
LHPQGKQCQAFVWIDLESNGRTKAILNKLTCRIAKAKEEERSWKEECRKANMKLGDTEKFMLEDTATELQKRKKGKPT